MVCFLFFSFFLIERFQSVNISLTILTVRNTFLLVGLLYSACVIMLLYMSTMWLPFIPSILLQCHQYHLASLTWNVVKKKLKYKKTFNILQ